MHRVKIPSGKTAGTVPSRRSLAPALDRASGPASFSVLCGFLAVTMCFGVARIQASNSLAYVDRSVDVPAFSMRMIEFKPQDFAPAAFADWGDQPSAH